MKKIDRLNAQADEENGPRLRVMESVNELEVGRIIGELICRKPMKRQ